MKWPFEPIRLKLLSGECSREVMRLPCSGKVSSWVMMMTGMILFSFTIVDEDFIPTIVVQVGYI